MTALTLEAAANRRHLRDRRRLTLTTVYYGFKLGRRRGQRRGDDVQHYVSDQQHPSILLLAVASVILSMSDALMTLKLLRMGARELNPVMAMVVDNPPLFLLVKLGLTLACVLPLVLFRDFKLIPRLPLSRLLLIIPTVYLLVIGWELILVHLLRAG